MKLSDYLITQQIGPAEFARQIEVGRMSVHRYISGERFPRPDVLQRIYQATRGQVTPNDFLLSPAPAPGNAPGTASGIASGSCLKSEHDVSSAVECSHGVKTSGDIESSGGVGFDFSGGRELIGRPLYPWSRLTANEQQVLDDAYDDMMDEPPEGSGLSPVVQQALETLGNRATYGNDQFKLDGQISRITSLIEEANRLRRQQGLPLLRYPGVAL